MMNFALAEGLIAFLFSIVAIFRNNYDAAALFWIAAAVFNNAAARWGREQ